MADQVTANALPLSLEQLIINQPSPDKLYLKLNRKLGELPPKDTVKTVTANALPLALNQKISEQPPASRLPLTLNRKLGTLDAVVTPTDPTTPKRTMSGVSIAMQGSTVAAVDIAKSSSNLQLAIAIAETARAYRQMGINVADDYWSLLKPFINLGVRTSSVIYTLFKIKLQPLIRSKGLSFASNIIFFS